MKKKQTNNALKRSLLLVPSIFAFVSCSIDVPLYLNEEGRSEFCANVQAMETDPNYLYFYSPKENNSEYTFDESENFDMFCCEKRDGFFHLRKDDEQADMEKQIAGEGTAYDFGIASLEKHGYKNAFTVKDILPFAKESAKKVENVKRLGSSLYYYFDMEQSVFDSFKAFRATHFNSRLNEAIDEDGSLYFDTYGFTSLNLFVGSIDGRMTEKGVLQWMNCYVFTQED